MILPRSLLGPQTAQNWGSHSFHSKNKEERYSRVHRLSDTRYSAKWRYARSKARLKCATYRR